MTVRRYPLEPLFALTGWTLNEIRRLAPCGGAEYRRRREEGVTERIADRLAIAAHLHPFEVWPEMADQVAAAVEVECPGCEARFVPHWKTQRYCSPGCRSRAHQRRKYATDPDFAERKRQARYEDYQDAGGYERARQRRYYAANAERIRAQRRERYRRSMSPPSAHDPDMTTEAA